MCEMSLTSYTTHLQDLYGAGQAEKLALRIQALINKYSENMVHPLESNLSERDAILITYGDQVQASDSLPLQVLGSFCANHLKGLVSGVHILPFYPWSSDDGFSVKDFRAVDPALGTWRDVEQLRRTFRLMVDAVINHASTQGEWFQAFLRDETPYRDYFLTVEGSPDLSQVVRPRALPLLTEFHTSLGIRKVWTTFSADQADLNFHNPDVLLEIIDILLMYAARGAQFIRLDAIAYLWKEVGTSCIHLPQTHAIIQLFRAVFDAAAPHVRLITETNVPHPDNISYFGDGTNEAQLVYNFALPPLVMHTLKTGNTAILSTWAAGLKLPSKQTKFFNFLASHDGIGLNPAKGILTTAQIDALVQQTMQHGGLISYKQNADGSASPYELNINYFDALSDPNGNEELRLQVARFMAAQAVMLALQGVPGIYFHSLFGSRSWAEGVRQTGHNRTINRKKLELVPLEAELEDAQSLRAQVFGSFVQLLKQRAGSHAFHPLGSQKILDMGTSIFAVERVSPDGTDTITCLHNMTATKTIAAGYALEPYQVVWVERK